MGGLAEKRPPSHAFSTLLPVVPKGRERGNDAEYVVGVAIHPGLCGYAEHADA